MQYVHTLRRNDEVELEKYIGNEGGPSENGAQKNDLAGDEHNPTPPPENNQINSMPSSTYPQTGIPLSSAQPSFKQQANSQGPATEQYTTSKTPANEQDSTSKAQTDSEAPATEQDMTSKTQH